MNERPSASADLLCKWTAGSRLETPASWYHILTCSRTGMHKRLHLSWMLTSVLDPCFSHQLFRKGLHEDRTRWKASSALFRILGIDYLTLNFWFCSSSIIVSPTLISSFVSGSPSLWPDCTLMSIRAMATTQRAFYGKAMEDADTSCNTQRLAPLWECLFALTKMLCERGVWTDGTAGAKATLEAGGHSVGIFCNNTNKIPV